MGQRIVRIDARGVAECSFLDGDRFYVDLATLTDEQRTAQRANMATICVKASDPYMHHPHLLHRLGPVRVPHLGIWGDTDPLVTPDYGRVLLDAFPSS